MKRVLGALVVGLLLWTQPASAAFAVVASAHASDAFTATTSAINTTGANLLIITVTDYTGSAAATPSDSKGNTWTALTARTAGNTRVRMYYAVNPTVGSGHTFTVTNSGNLNFIGTCVIAVSGADTVTPLDTESGTSSTGFTTIQPGSITPVNSDELFIASVGFEDSATATIDSSFTQQEIAPFIGGGSFYNSLAYKIKTNSTAENPTWTASAFTKGGAVMAAFKTGGVTPPSCTAPPGSMLMLKVGNCKG